MREDLKKNDVFDHVTKKAKKETEKEQKKWKNW